MLAFPSSPHYHEHGDDHAELFLGGLDLSLAHQVEPPGNIENRRTFCGRATGDTVEPRLLAASELTGTFGNVQRDRDSGAVELIREHTTTAWQARANRVCRNNEVHRPAIDFQPLMIAERARELPVEKQREVLDFVEFLRVHEAPKRSLRDVAGLFKGFDISPEDIDEARREMWAASGATEGRTSAG